VTGLKWYVLENTKKGDEMNLIINGENQEFDNGKTLQFIIESLKIEDKVMAAAVNMEIVKKDQWSEFIPQDNDKIELLQFVGGG